MVYSLLHARDLYLQESRLTELRNFHNLSFSFQSVNIGNLSSFSVVLNESVTLKRLVIYNYPYSKLLPLQLSCNERVKLESWPNASSLFTPELYFQHTFIVSMSCQNLDKDIVTVVSAHVDKTYKNVVRCTVRTYQTERTRYVSVKK